MTETRGELRVTALPPDASPPQMSLDRSVSLDQPAIPVLLSDPRVRRIGVLECGEPLVDVRRFPRVVVDTRMSDPEGAWAFVRVGVLDRLLRAADALPAGIRLVLVEGYRPMSLQRTSFIEYLDELTDALPDLDGDAAWMQASAYVSPPEIAPHCAGAAVDVTLIDSTGAELDMGTRVNASPLESHGRCTTDAFGLTPEQRRNRALLRAVLEQAGFVNYPALWWHYSYGDCYWALATGRAAALYGRIESPWAASTA